jgi:glycine oxidase
MDAVVIGGGVIGLASALELAAAGMRVSLLDRSEPGTEASWAAAGILGPQSESHGPGPMLDLCLRSFEQYGEWVARLGVDVGYERCGTLHLAFTRAEADALVAMRDWQLAAGLRAELRNDARALVALWLPDEGRVDARLLVTALRAEVKKRGIAIRQSEVGRLDRVEGELAVVAAGAWSGPIAGVRVEPVRGQLLLLDVPPPPSVVFGAGGYLVPRGGRTLVGATVEHTGFDKSTTRDGRLQLEAIATRLGAAGNVLDHWAGLRPGTADGLPLLGRTEWGDIVATGHYRNGILLAPVTAKIVRALALGEAPPVDLKPFAPGRPLPAAAAHAS